MDALGRRRVQSKIRPANKSKDLMKRIYSKLESGRLLHFIEKPDNYGPREDLIDQQEILQLSSMAVSKGTSFRAHRHIPKTVNLSQITAQESWVIISGKVLVTYFDLDDSVLESVLLEEGDVSVTLAGGHGYDIVEDSRILEFKTGPYLGQLLDKVFIDE